MCALFKEIQSHTGQPDAMAIGMAGAREESDRARIRAAAQHVWPGIPCLAANDLETGLAANDDEGAGRKPATRVLVVSGTGSCCYGKNKAGKTVKVGGWGHILGDQGSGYAIGMEALKAIIETFDATGQWPRLGERILRRLLLNDPNDLIQWAQNAAKDDVAALSVEVFEAWKDGDSLSENIATQEADRLARDADRCASRLVRRGQTVSFILSGGVLLKQPAYAALFSRFLLKLRPDADIRPLAREGAWGAVALAFQADGRPPMLHGGLKPNSEAALIDKVAADLAESPTEQRHPLSANLDKMSTLEAMELMLSEDSKIPRAILERRQTIEKTIQLIVRQMRKGGRLFYAGAGTSGRLGVLDASECPPTFRTDPDRIQGIIAGGQRALWQAVEGAEDDREAGARAAAFRGVCSKDVVVGIAASGRTPFVHGALAEARQRKAATVLLTFNPGLKSRPGEPPDILIAVNVGPEILTGSTRLKAGTATKMILNMFTTLSMVKLGKVVGNLMIDLNPSNIKLRDRAVRILCELTGATPPEAQAALQSRGWIVADAFKMLGRKRET
jgi:N-acetylmuramic acid 6-phosphate etherase